jgi:hypothetical protein
MSILILNQRVICSKFRKVTMERISKKELEDLILHGLAPDIFIAERAFSMFRTIGEKSKELSERNNYGEFFGSTQTAFKDQFLLAVSRIFDTPSKRNKTRCVKGVLQFLSDNSKRLPEIVERYNLILVMEKAGFDRQATKLVEQVNKDAEVTIAIVNHFNSLLESSQNKKLILRIKELRDKKLAHNELIKNELPEAIDIITFKDLFSLVEIAKDLIGIIGWAYMSTMFVHNGVYHLTADAKRPSSSLARLIEKIISR